MAIYSKLVGACWVMFVVYWFVSAMGAKRTVRFGARQIVIRVIVAALVLLFVRSRPAGVGRGFTGTISSPVVRTLGVVLCAAGIAYAIWARRHIGKNWGMPMSVKERPELVSSGPYAHIRHPIYAGIVLALAGSALAVSLWWLVAAVIALVYFSYAAREEEKTMLGAFPQEYEAYQRRTNMIVPFLF